MNRIDATHAVAPPAYLPLHRSGVTGSSFAGAIRAEVARQLQASPAPVSQAPVTGPYTMLQHATTSGSNDPGESYWAAQARSIGGQYLTPDVANVFERQMALESGNFSPDVISGRRVSTAGAQGIAQLMPESYPNVNRLDPVQSLHAAAATMRDNLARYSGDLSKALAAYNAGPAAVDAAVAGAGPQWQSQLPAETQQYLAILLGRTNTR